MRPDWRHYGRKLRVDRRTRVRVHVIRVTRRVLHSIAQRRMGFELLMTEQSSVQQLLATCQVEYLPGNGVRMHTHTTAPGGIHGFRGRQLVPAGERPLGKSAILLKAKHERSLSFIKPTWVTRSPLVLRG